MMPPSESSSPDSGIMTNSPESEASNGLNFKEPSLGPTKDPSFSKPATPISSPPGHSLFPVSCASLEEAAMPPEIVIFAKLLKQKRIELGYTQADVGRVLGHFTDAPLSQTTICRFESFQLSLKNMYSLKPVLEKVLHEMQTDKNLLDRLTSGQLKPQPQKRKQRTSIDAPAKRVLEEFFSNEPTPSAEEQRNLAATLNMEKNVVNSWFCNRRQKQKRKHPSDMAATPQSNSCAYNAAPVTPCPSANAYNALATPRPSTNAYNAPANPLLGVNAYNALATLHPSTNAYNALATPLLGVNAYNGPATPHPSANAYNAPATPHPSANVYNAPATPRPSANAYNAPATPRPSANAYNAPATPRPSANAYNAPATPRPSANAYNAPATPRPSANAYNAPATPRPSANAYNAPATPRPSANAYNAPVTPRPSAYAIPWPRAYAYNALATPQRNAYPYNAQATPRPSDNAPATPQCSAYAYNAPATTRPSTCSYTLLQMLPQDYAQEAMTPCYQVDFQTNCLST